MSLFVAVVVAGAQSWSQEQVGLQPTDDNESAPPAKPNAGPALVRSYSFAPGRKGGPSEGPSGSGAGTHPETNADALQEDLEMKATQDAKRFKQMLHAEGLVATRTFDSEDEYAVFAPKRIGTGAPVLAIGQRFAMTLMAEEKPQERHAAGHADTQPRLQIRSVGGLEEEARPAVPTSQDGSSVVFVMRKLFSSS